MRDILQNTESKLLKKFKVMKNKKKRRKVSQSRRD